MCSEDLLRVAFKRRRRRGMDARGKGGRARQQPRHICLHHLMQRVSSETCLSPISFPSLCGLIVTSSRSAISGSKQETIPFACLRAPLRFYLRILPTTLWGGSKCPELLWKICGESGMKSDHKYWLKKPAPKHHIRKRRTQNSATNSLQMGARQCNICINY